MQILAGGLPHSASGEHACADIRRRPRRRVDAWCGCRVEVQYLRCAASWCRCQCVRTDSILTNMRGRMRWAPRGVQGCQAKLLHRLPSTAETFVFSLHHRPSPSPTSPWRCAECASTPRLPPTHECQATDALWTMPLAPGPASPRSSAAAASCDSSGTDPAESSPLHYYCACRRNTRG